MLPLGLGLCMALAGGGETQGSMTLSPLGVWWGIPQHQLCWASPLPSLGPRAAFPVVCLFCRCLVAIQIAGPCASPDVGDKKQCRDIQHVVLKSCGPSLPDFFFPAFRILYNECLLDYVQGGGTGKGSPRHPSCSGTGSPFPGGFTITIFSL